MEKHLNILKLSDNVFNPVNRSRSVSGASTGLSSSPLSSPRVRLDPQRIKRNQQKIQFHEAFLPEKCQRHHFCLLKIGFVVCLEGFNYLSEV